MSRFVEAQFAKKYVRTAHHTHECVYHRQCVLEFTLEIGGGVKVLGKFLFFTSVGK